MIGTHLHHTKGRWLGYYFRRTVHVALLLPPILYYYFLPNWLFGSSVSLSACLLWTAIAVIVLEGLRLYFGILLIGHREYEKKQVSSFASGLLSLLAVLWLAPGPEFGFPIIASCALADPILGELRRFMRSVALVEVIGWLVLLVIWWWSYIFLGAPLWCVFVLPVVALLSEYPSWHWFDDNASMQLVPLAVILLVLYFT